MDIVRSRRNIAMSHKNLNCPKISIIFKEMGCEAVTKRMDGSRFGNANLIFSHLKDVLNISGNDRFAFNKTGKKKISGSVMVPVEPEQFKVFMR
ncbi:hypothetical protein SAMN02746098_03813 [Desulfosporosinus lacus DSM 15449]|uniref:Uncharacterized protein n=1 Tax=Desulfosporosinus lacus DSM 15449 TaxID=1121420 RepID=A0A1M5ZY70_9FIRM|nr:hypothetical protein SAMN02746098_03813 [Desulfosporosinus lacus DSM 15449]